MIPALYRDLGSYGSAAGAKDDILWKTPPPPLEVWHRRSQVPTPPSCTPTEAIRLFTADGYPERVRQVGEPRGAEPVEAATPFRQPATDTPFTAPGERGSSDR
jgi:hypothetical protein